MRGCSANALGDPSPTDVCAHTWTHLHTWLRSPVNRTTSKNLIFSLVSFYLKERLPKERRGWAGGAVAGDTGGIKRCVSQFLLCCFWTLLLLAKRVCSSRRCCTAMYFCLSRAEFYRIVTFVPCNNVFRKKHWGRVFISVRRVCNGVWGKLSLHTTDPRENNTGPHLAQVMFGQPRAQRCSLKETDVKGMGNSELMDKWHLPLCARVQLPWILVLHNCKEIKVCRGRNF